MAKWDLDAVDKLEEINRLQAQTIERIQGERIEALNKNAWQAQKIAHLEEQLRQAQQSLRNARDSALEDAWLVVMQRVDVALRIGTEDEEGALQEAADAIRALKSTTQGSRE